MTAVTAIVGLFYLAGPLSAYAADNHATCQRQIEKIEARLATQFARTVNTAARPNSDAAISTWSESAAGVGTGTARSTAGTRTATGIRSAELAFGAPD
jgi:hypothetical protein